MRKVLIVAGAVLGVLILAVAAAAFVAPAAIDWKGRLAEAAREATGRELAIDGAVEVALVPAIRVRAEGLRLANAEGMAEPDMATVEALSARVALWPLVAGRVVVEELVIRRPELVLRVGEDGWRNWTFEAAVQEGEVEPAEPGEAPMAGLVLGDVRLVDGRVSYINAVTGQRVEAADIRATAGLPALDRPLTAALDMRVNDEPVAARLSLETPAAAMAGERAALSASLEAQTVTARYDGGVRTRPVPGLDGTFKLSIPSVGALAAWLDRPLAEDQPDPGALRVNAVFQADGRTTTLERLEIDGEGLHATASGRLDTSGEVTEVVLDVESESLDVDRFLPPPAPAGETAARRAMPRHEPGEMLAALPEEPFDLGPLRTTRADVRISVNGIRARGYRVGRVLFTARAADGVLEAELAELKLYGGGASGSLRLDASGEALDARLDLGLEKVDLGALAQAAAREPAPVAGVASGALVLEGRGASPRALARGLSGHLAFELGEVDLAEAPAGVAVSAADLNVDLPGLEAQPTLDGRVVYNGEPVELRATLDPLREVLSGERFAADLALESKHLRLAYDGRVQRRPAPGLDGDFRLEVASVGRLAAWLGRPLPQGRPDPGRLDVRASFAASGPTFEIESATIEGEALEATVSGRVDHGGAVPEVKLDVRAGVLDLDRYLPPPAAGAAPQADAQPAAAGRGPLAGLPAEPFDLAPLRRMRAEVSLRAEAIRAMGTEVGRTAVDLALKDGTATVDVGELRIYGGEVAGRGRFAAEDGALAVELDATARGLDAGKLAAAAGAAPLAGRAEASLKASGRGADPRALARALAGSAAFALTEAEVAVAGGTLSRLEARVDLPGLDKQASAEGTAVFNGETVEVDARLGPLADALAQKPVAAELKVAAKPVSMSYAGSLAAPPAPGLDGRVELEVPSVARLAAWLGRPLDEAQPDPGRLSVAATVEGGPGRMRLAEARIQGKAIEASARGVVETAATPARFDLSVDVKQADLDAYLPPPAKGEGGAKAGGEAASGAAAEPAGWSDEPIIAPPLQAAEGKAVVTLGSVRYRGLDMTDGRLTLALAGGVLETTLERLAVSQGRLQAAATVDASGAVPQLNYRATGEGIESQPVLRAFAGTDRLSGKANLRAEGRARGRSQKELVGALDGEGSFTFVDGAIHGINLAARLRQAKSLGLDEDAAETRKTDFAELSGTYTIEDGVLVNRDLKMLAPLLRIDGAGRVMLPPRTIDYTAEAKLVGTLKGQGGQQALKGIPIPIRVTGPLDKPNYTVDWQSVFRQAAQDPERLRQMPEQLREQAGQLGIDLPLPGSGEGAGEGVQRLLEGLSGSQTQEGTTTQEGAEGTTQEEKSPTDALKEGLKSLFGN